MKKFFLSMTVVSTMLLPHQAFALSSGAMANATATGAKAAGHGFAFSGVADDPSAVWFNPAGMVQVPGFQTTAGVTVIHLHASHEDEAGHVDTMASKYPVIPYFYLTATPAESKWSFGLGVNSPYGLASEWRDDSFSRFYATRSNLFMYAINPNVAYAVNDKFSVAVGADYFNAFDVELNSLVSPLTASGSTGRSKLEGDGDGWGYNAAMLWKPVEKHSFGLSYRSQVNVPVKGSVNVSGLDAAYGGFGVATSFSSGVSSEFKFPQTVTLGYGFKPNDRWTIYTDYEWANWNVVDETHINYDSSNAVLAQNTNIPRHWKNSNNFGAGAQLKANERWDFRFGGLIYERVIPDGSIEASLPESSRWMLAAGTGYHFKSTTIDFAVGDVVYNSRHLDNSSMGAANVSQDGTYKTHAPFASLSVTQKWGGQ